MKKFEDSEVNYCRWSEYVREHLGEWMVLWDNSYADYQGTAEILATHEGRFAYVKYSYGSCSGCDGWEDMDEESRAADFANMIEYFDDVHALKQFADQVRYDEGFHKAIAEYVATAEIESSLLSDTQR